MRACISKTFISERFEEKFFMECEELFYAEGPKKYGPDMYICKVNNEPLSEDQINQMCRNNCVSCCLYRSRHGSARPNSQNRNNSGARPV